MTEDISGIADRANMLMGQVSFLVNSCGSGKCDHPKRNEECDDALEALLRQLFPYDEHRVNVIDQPLTGWGLILRVADGHPTVYYIDDKENYRVVDIDERNRTTLWMMAQRAEAGFG